MDFGAIQKGNIRVGVEWYTKNVNEENIKHFVVQLSRYPTIQTFELVYTILRQDLLFVNYFKPLIMYLIPRLQSAKEKERIHRSLKLLGLGEFGDRAKALVDGNELPNPNPVKYNDIPVDSLASRIFFKNRVELDQMITMDQSMIDFVMDMFEDDLLNQNVRPPLPRRFFSQVVRDDAL